jgi:hypothetical protein
VTLVSNAKASLATSRWVVGATGQVRRQLRGGGRVDEVTVPSPPPVSLRSTRALRVSLRVATRNCLRRSLLRQAWFAAEGDQRDIVIGVRRSPKFGAHAWLEGDVVPPEEAFEELLRLPGR